MSLKDANHDRHETGETKREHPPPRNLVATARAILIRSKSGK
jgi:hypothetical protein